MADDKKKEVKLKTTSQKWKMYDSSGKRKNQFCPKCGPGVFLAQHKDRLVCGTCHYMEKISSDDKKEDSEKPKEESKKEVSEIKSVSDDAQKSSISDKPKK
jgi:ubiquitin-small subunit ribosomal protein S27Ae